jgi:putative SOS response-associated peptidase YedK
MRLAADESASIHVRAIACLKLEELKNWLSKKMNSAKDESQKAHYFYAVLQIKLFQDDPNKVKLTAPLSPPHGAPIGMNNR